MPTIRDFLKYFQDKSLKINNLNVDESQVISAPKNIHEARKDHLTFINRKFKSELKSLIEGTEASLILIESDLMSNALELKLERNLALIAADNPKKVMIDAINYFFPSTIATPLTHASAIIHASAKIGNNAWIGPNVVIEEDVTLGEDCIIEANSVIKKGTIIGNHVRIKSCSVIGGVGFGYDKDEDESAYQFLPHFGRVIIEDEVDIGSNTCIDRGSLSDTIIKKGVKIDNLVHIAHNVQIGENTLVIACSMIAGSVKIGENCWIAPAAVIRNGLKIGNNSTVGLGSVLTNDLGENKTVLGVPAIEIEDFKYLRNHQKEILKAKADKNKTP